ncbi:MAG: alpha/beta hydrolase [Halieaceae bacterium]
MALDPEVIPLLEFFEELGMPDLSTATPQEFRDAMLAIPVEDPTAVAAVENRSIPGPAGELPIRVFRPEGEGPFPLLLFFHGGGWVVGDLDSHDETARQLCAGAGVVVLSVDYRLAPEAKFPAAPEDCYAATAWAAAHADELDVDASRIAVSGDSAGGNLAIAVCLMARERGGPRISHQFLLYPVTDHNFETDSYRDNADGYFLTRAMMQWFWGHYLPSPADADNPLTAPLHADLSALPAATVITAGYDPLRDEGIAFAEALVEAGVEVEQRLFEGMIHGFVTIPGGLTQTGVAVDYLCQRLKSTL